MVTAYRQDALRCLEHLSRNGPSRGAEVAAGTGVTTATRLMADDHYGWFERVERGVYGLTPNGSQAVQDFAAELAAIAADADGSGTGPDHAIA